MIVALLQTVNEIIIIMIKIKDAELGEQRKVKFMLSVTFGGFSSLSQIWFVAIIMAHGIGLANSYIFVARFSHNSVKWGREGEAGCNAPRVELEYPQLCQEWGWRRCQRVCSSYSGKRRHRESKLQLELELELRLRVLSPLPLLRSANGRRSAAAAAKTDVLEM